MTLLLPDYSNNPNNTNLHTNNLLTRRSKDNYQRVIALDERMFNVRSRYLILVLTLGYKPEYHPFINLDHLRNDRDHLLKNIPTNNLLQGINAYIWKIEEGEEGNGLHMHLVIYYEGQHRADIYIAEQIGLYWNTVITKGMGSYWNSNRDKIRNRSGPYGDITGQLNRLDSLKRDAYCDYMGEYICKEDQGILLKAHPRVRLFGTSQLPLFYRS